MELNVDIYEAMDVIKDRPLLRGPGYIVSPTQIWLCPKEWAIEQDKKEF